MKKVNNYLHIFAMLLCLLFFSIDANAEKGMSDFEASPTDVIGVSDFGVCSLNIDGVSFLELCSVEGNGVFALEASSVKSFGVSYERSDVTANTEGLVKEKTDELLNEFSLILPDGMEDLVNDPTQGVGFDSLLSEVISVINGEMPSFLVFLFLLIGCAVIVALVTQLGDGVSSIARYGVAVAVGCVVLFKVFPLLTASADALGEIGTFFTSLLPIVVGGAALSGGGVATTSGVGMSLTLSFIGGVTSLVFPLIGATLILAVISALSTDILAIPLDTVRKHLVRTFGIMTAVIGGLFSLQTSVASVGDGATIRALKYAVGNSIPVVGGAVSGTLSTLVGGLGYAMGVIGGGGVAVILSLSLSPLVKLFLYRFAFFVVGLFLDLFPQGEGSRLISAISGGLDALIAVLSLSVAVYLLEIVVVMKSVISIL